MPELILDNVVKVYGKDNTAVDHFNLHVKDQEFIVFVGPSGCGKSTTLRMIAGLEEITSGELLIDGKVMNDVAPKDRDIAMVFQNYALYPHMNVYDNMAFGLKLRKLKKSVIKEKVEHAAAILGLEDYLDRKPKALSGGQRQRVALGRAIVRDAKVFLMDEPLSNLDAKLRVQMRAEIQKLHQQLGTTSIYVTHDQTEAMTMATRLVVMKEGLIQQVGTPKEVYDNPNNMFVGGFIGSPPMNFLKGKVLKDHLKIGELFLKLPESKKKMLHHQGYLHQEVMLGIRPEHIYSNPNFHPDAEEMKIRGTIEVFELMGADTFLYISSNGERFVTREDAKVFFKNGEAIDLYFDLNKGLFFDEKTEERIKEEKVIDKKIEYLGEISV